MAMIETAIPIPGVDCTEGEGGVFSCEVGGQVRDEEQFQKIETIFDTLILVIPIVFIVSLILFIYFFKRLKGIKFIVSLFLILLLALLTFGIAFKDVIAPWLYI